MAIKLFIYLLKKIGLKKGCNRAPDLQFWPEMVGIGQHYPTILARTGWNWLTLDKLWLELVEETVERQDN